MFKSTEVVLFAFLSCLLPVSPCIGAGVLSEEKQPAALAIPPTPVGKLLDEFIQTVNSGDPKRIDAFVSNEFLLTKQAVDSWPTQCSDHEQVCRTLLNFSKRSGGLVVESLIPQETEIVTFFRTKKGGRKIYVLFKISAESPARIESYQIVESPPDLVDYLPETLSAGSIAEKVEAIRQAFEKASSRDLFSGTVLVSYHGKLLYTGAYGEANKDYKTKINANTLFGIASLGKLFTGVAVAQLVSAGKLSYDEPILRYLPDYPNKEVAAKITLRELLNHTSGLADIFAKESPKFPLERLTDYYPLFSNEPLLFEPGKGQSYSNTGFLVASMIVEAISGEDFREYLKKHIFDPAGMSDTGWGHPANLVKPYMRDNADDPLNPDSPWISADSFFAALLGGPALGHGGEYSTAMDLLKFAVALKSGKLLDADSLSILVRDHLGCQSYDRPGHRVYSHSGGGPGVNSLLKLYLDQDCVVVVLSNYSPPFPQIIGGAIGDLIVGP